MWSLRPHLRRTSTYQGFISPNCVHTRHAYPISDLACFIVNTNQCLVRPHIVANSTSHFPWEDKVDKECARLDTWLVYCRDISRFISTKLGQIRKSVRSSTLITTVQCTSACLVHTHLICRRLVSLSHCVSKPVSFITNYYTLYRRPRHSNGKTMAVMDPRSTRACVRFNEKTEKRKERCLGDATIARLCG